MTVIKSRSGVLMKRKLMAIIMISIFYIIIFSGCTEETLTVDKLLDNQFKYTDKEVRVEGYIKTDSFLTINGSDFYTTYYLYDVSGNNYIFLNTLYIKTTPVNVRLIYSGITNNDHVIVTGIYYREGNFVNATKIEKLN